jgi:glycerophosphoryl diester phosphodiesterase
MRGSRSLVLAGLLAGVLSAAGCDSAVEPGTAPSSARATSTARASSTARATSTDEALAPTPLVIAHRGASGYRPEHTLAAYELAVQMGADYIEPDLVMTKDGVLVDRHEPEISATTDVADHPEFASRRTTKLLDGVSTTGWFTEDFSEGELKKLRVKERIPDVRKANTRYDRKYQVPTFEEVLRLRDRLSKSTGRTIGVIPEIKHSTFFHAAGLNPESAVMEAVQRHGLNRTSAPLWIQSFEVGSLKTLRQTYHYQGKSVLLVTRGGGPFDLRSAGAGRSYAELLTPTGLRSLAAFVDGIGPDKALVIPRTPTGALSQPTSLVPAAHAAGLEVLPWTFRAENTFLPTEDRVGADPDALGHGQAEARAYLSAGVDGLFCDQPDICVAARKAFLGHG